jgi:hypothetical protein
MVVVVVDESDTGSRSRDRHNGSVSGDGWLSLDPPRELMVVGVA